MASLRAEEREAVGFMKRYTQNVQVYQRSKLLLNPNDNVAEARLAKLKQDGHFIGCAQPVNLSYTNTFSTTMCGMLGRSPMDQLESNVLLGSNAYALKEAKKMGLAQRSVRTTPSARSAVVPPREEE